MKVLLDINEKYAAVLTVTAMGHRVDGMDATVTAVDLKKVNHIRIDANGKAHFAMEEVDQ